MNSRQIEMNVDVLEALGNQPLPAGILDDPEFIRYFTSRTGYSLACEADANDKQRYPMPGPAHRRLLANPPDSCWRITRGKLINAWEVFCRNNRS